MNDATFNEKSHFKISLPMAIQVIGFIVALVYGYTVLDSRISFLEHELQLNSNAINDLLELQDKPIPSDIKQDTELEHLKAIINSLNADIEYLKRKIYH